MAGYDWTEQVLMLNRGSIFHTVEEAKTGFVAGKWIPLQAAGVNAFADFALAQMTFAAEAGLLPSTAHEIFAAEEDLDEFYESMSTNPLRSLTDRAYIALEQLLQLDNGDDEEGLFSNRTVAYLFRDLWDKEEAA